MKFMNMIIVICTDHFNDSDDIISAFTALHFYSEILYNNTRRKMLVFQLLLVQQQVIG
jgi:hypothetical protein